MSEMWQTIKPVLDAFGQMSAGISNEHLAKQIASQVEAWEKTRPVKCGNCMGSGREPWSPYDPEPRDCYRCKGKGYLTPRGSA